MLMFLLFKGFKLNFKVYTEKKLDIYHSPPFSKVIRFIRFNRWCNESSGFSVHFHSGLVLYMCIQACVSCLEV